MNKTTDTHRLYTLLALVLGMMLLSAGPAAAGAGERGELDGWIHGRGAETNDGPATSDGSQREDGWVRGGGLESLSGSSTRQPLPVDGWAVGQGLRSQTSQTPQTTTVVDQPSSTPAPSIPTLAIGLAVAALLGAVVAGVRSHRHAPSAH